MKVKCLSELELLKTLINFLCNGFPDLMDYDKLMKQVIDFRFIPRSSNIGFCALSNSYLVKPTMPVSAVRGILLRTNGWHVDPPIQYDY